MLKLVQKLSESIHFSKAVTILRSLLLTQVFLPLIFHNKINPQITFQPIPGEQSISFLF